MTTARWSDLPSRLYSALALIVVGFWAVFYGGLFLLFAVSILVSVMHFELAKMQSPHKSGAPKFSSLVGLMTLMIINYSTNWFLSLLDAKQKIEQWRRDYNGFRPHSSLNNSKNSIEDIILKE